ncbi:hypothetical protein HK101_004722 [Irineochytrium annulatum]|nr:hypothetical protein HK101_004722 [Irineochytrium annulatum]
MPLAAPSASPAAAANPPPGAVVGPTPYIPHYPNSGSSNPGPGSAAGGATGSGAADSNAGATMAAGTKVAVGASVGLAAALAAVGLAYGWRKRKAAAAGADAKGFMALGQKRETVDVFRNAGSPQPDQWSGTVGSPPPGEWAAMAMPPMVPVDNRSTYQPFGSFERQYGLQEQQGQQWNDGYMLHDNAYAEPVRHEYAPAQPQGQWEVYGAASVRPLQPAAAVGGIDHDHWRESAAESLYTLEDSGHDGHERGADAQDRATVLMSMMNGNGLGGIPGGADLTIERLRADGGAYTDTTPRGSVMSALTDVSSPSPYYTIVRGERVPVGGGGGEEEWEYDGEEELLMTPVTAGTTRHVRNGSVEEVMRQGAYRDEGMARSVMARAREELENEARDGGRGLLDVTLAELATTPEGAVDRGVRDWDGEGGVKGAFKMAFRRTMESGDLRDSFASGVSSDLDPMATIKWK